MPDLLDELARENPVSSDREGEMTPRDRAVLQKVLDGASPGATIHMPRRVWGGVAMAGLAVALAAVIVLTGEGRDRASLDAAARTYAALTFPNGIFHFVTVSRVTQTPKRATIFGIGFASRSAFPNVLGGRHLHAILGRLQYEEDWITTDGSRVRWRKFTLRHGRPARLIAAFAGKTNFTADDIADPATAFRFAYRDGQLESRGPMTFAGTPAWRFVDDRGGYDQEWIVSRDDWLPLRYSNVERGNAYGVDYTNRQIVRFLKFERIPLTSETAHVFKPTTAERAVGSRS